MKRTTSIVWAAVATVGLLAGCGQGGSAGPAETAAEPTGSGTRAVVTDAPATADVVAATWSLGVATLRTGDGPNVVVSPSSLVTALSMLGEGAVGTEAAPFDAALGAAGQDRTDAVNALQTALGRYDGDPAVVQAAKLPATPVLHTAQRVVVDDDAQPAQQFLDRLQQGYGAGVLVTDLGSETGTEELSAWVKENTGGLVDKTAIKPDPATTAVLQDAFVLAAAWQRKFDPDDTYDADFWVPGDQAQATVPTMHAQLSVPTVEVDGWRAVRLPYTDDLSADLLLPLGCDCPEDAVCDCQHLPEFDDPRLIDPQTLAGLSAALDDAQPSRIEVAVPTLDLATTTDLMGLLADLGIGSDPLTGVRADGDPVLVSQAVQQAVLEVAEDGTRAAAVTEVGMVGAAPEPDQVEEVRFDRPFLLVVRDGSTGWPVLLASVSDPR